jgi:hypothetical protein
MRKQALVIFKDNRKPFFVGGSRKTDEIYFEGSDLKVKDLDGHIHNYENILLEGQCGFIVSNLDRVQSEADVVVIIDDNDDEVTLSMPEWMLTWLLDNGTANEGIFDLWIEDDYICLKNR